MSLTAGTRLGPYEVIGPLGAGGMGEVFRARDTKLNRVVALKVLPPEFTSDPERVARFRREAQVLASLNHPHIAQIYGLEDGETVSGPASALVMELVEGQTLAARLERGTLGPDESVQIALQIAAALEAAHEKGIIHRDLKPANIALDAEGRVKVLDFGLAKALDPSAGAGGGTGLPNSPTITSPALVTGAGMLLGTAAYMSPEQARGKTADTRADVWAFGCVLYEMLTGKRAFEGDEVSDTLAFVLTREPDWAALPSTTPPPIRRLLKRCLTKHPRERLRDIGDARIELHDVAAGTTTESLADVGPPPRGSRSVAWAVAAVAGLLAATLGWRELQRAPEESHSYRTSILLPEDATFPAQTFAPGRFSLSPDGRWLAFAAIPARQQQPMLWVRNLMTAEARILAGTESGVYPSWSPDSRFIAFLAGRALKIIDTFGGPPRTLAEGVTGSDRITWNRDNVILFVPTGGAIHRVSASGGESSPIGSGDAATATSSGSEPFFLPDGRRFLYRLRPRGIAVGSLDPTEARVRLQDDGVTPQYANGHLFFVREGSLLAQPFDANRLMSSGQPRLVADDLAISAGNAGGTYSVSQSGVLAYQTGGGELRSALVWFDRSGRDIGTLGQAGRLLGFALSPAETHVAAVTAGTARGSAGELSLIDVARNVSTPLGANRVLQDVAWAPDSRRLAVRGWLTDPPSGRENDHDDRSQIYEQPLSGHEKPTPLVDGAQRLPLHWSPDGKNLLIQVRNTKTLGDFWILPLTGDRKPYLFFQTAAAEAFARFSPDGRWIAYDSRKSNRFEVYVARYPGGGSDTRISIDGGQDPQWRADGKELFFVALDETLMAVDVEGSGEQFKVGTPRRLFQLRPPPRATRYAVAHNGQRLLVNTAEVRAGSTPITLLTNWPAGLAAPTERD